MDNKLFYKLLEGNLAMEKHILSSYSASRKLTHGKLRSHWHPFCKILLIEDVILKITKDSKWAKKRIGNIRVLIWQNILKTKLSSKALIHYQMYV